MGTIDVGFLIFPQLTQLDFTGPYEVLARVPGARVHVVAAASGPVTSDSGLVLSPTATLDGCPPLDVVCVPGGPGVGDVMEDEKALAFLAAQGARAKYVTSVCTGALVLGAAGLLTGYRATTHWMSLDLLPIFGATPVRERVVVDRNRVTGGGVTAGIDFGLRLAAELRGEQAARLIQLFIEYDPAPPFDAGSPERAGVGIADRIRASRAAQQEKRRALCEAAMRRLRAR
jgi:cyclohexyl-isocyanide hydratase